jgi:glycyl-tRNA synthetase beta chain
MSTRDLLIEIGTEELPPKALKQLSDAFTSGIREGLAQAELGHAAVSGLASPRRLAVIVRDLDESQQDKTVERRGPAVTAAFNDDGTPSKAAEGFARSCGVTIEQLERLKTDKGEWLVFHQAQPGQPTNTLIPDIIQSSLDQLPIPKRMRWGDLKAQFVRPVHWIVLLYGDELIEAELLSVRSGRQSRGHRFHHPDTIEISSPSDYEQQLLDTGMVIVDFEQRREKVRAQVDAVAAEAGGQAVIDEELLDEVTAMVEWPVALLGNFDTSFLEIAPEALISAMKGHQKYFHVVDGQGTMLPHFITVANIDSKDMSVVREGNERVIRPRLSDAGFFWNQDRKTKLADRLDGLKHVVFQNKLGTLYDKVTRIQTLAGLIANQLGGDSTAAERAAALAKCDLGTEMVGEFPDLQGIMGRYYARHDGEDEAVAEAIADHYRPRFSGDDLPAGIIGQAVSLADKLDTLVGIFGIGQAPTGDKDPFALRRAALGVIRILIELDLQLDLPVLILEARELFNAQQPGLLHDQVDDEVYGFITGRLPVYYSSQGFGHDEIEAVVCLRPAQLNDLDRRLRALAAFRKLAEAESLSAANKRISNIIRKSADGEIPAFDESRLQDDAEKQLFGDIITISQRVDPLFAQGDYTAAMQALAGLKTVVDNFFDNVMVNVDDTALRNNRLSLLSMLRNLFLRVADLSRLQ